jgi:hypothetical protein
MSSGSKTAMVAHELRRSILAPLLPLLIAGTIAGGCSQAPAPAQPQAAAPQAPAPSPSPSDNPSSPAPDPVKPVAKVPLREDRVVVIDPGDDETAIGEVSLVEVARGEKERRSHAAEPVAVITNRTLPAYAAKGQLTIATPGEQPPSTRQDAGDVPEIRDEQYWRARGLEIRRRWREAVDEIGQLEQDAAELRRRFYAEADPYRRDGQIKPEWDRVLDQLEDRRTEAEAAEEELEQFLEAGRQAGALPGWLQDGAEEEPPHKEPPPAPTDAIEPHEFGEELPELGEGPP